MWLFRSEVFIELGSDITMAEALVQEIRTHQKRKRISLPTKHLPPDSVYFWGSLLYDKLRVCQSDQRDIRLKMRVVEESAKPDLWH